MVSTDAFISITSSLPEVTLKPHFDKKAFCAGKKIFATLDEKKQMACVKLTVAEQDIFCAYNKSIIFPVPNKWGKQGWTNIDLKTVPEPMLIDVLKTAYRCVAPAKLVSKLSADNTSDDSEIL